MQEQIKQQVLMHERAVLWLVVHIAYLIGFRNRLLVLFQWAWEYITRQRNARLITCGDTSHVSAW